MATTLTEEEIRAIGAKIVQKSKSTARVDTGALKRSISFSYVKEVMIFRQMYYGQFGKNSQLEKNAIAMVPRGVQWKIIYTAFGGTTMEIGRTRSGRATQRNILKSITRGASNNIKALIAKSRAKKAAAKKLEDGKA
jgi:hypothetical protein